MFRSVYSVSLCCSVYCLCVNVYCTSATRCQARDFWRREKTKNTRGRQQITVCLSVYICVYVCPSLSLYIYIFFFLSLSIFLSLSVTGADLKTNGHILGDCCIALCFLLCNSPESEFYIPTFQNSVCSIFIPTRLWRWKRHSVPKRWHIKFTRRRIAHTKAYNIQNMAKVWNQEILGDFT